MFFYMDLVHKYIGFYFSLSFSLSAFQESFRLRIQRWLLYFIMMTYIQSILITVFKSYEHFLPWNNGNNVIMGILVHLIFYTEMTIAHSTSFNWVFNSPSDVYCNLGFSMTYSKKTSTQVKGFPQVFSLCVQALQ